MRQRASTVLCRPLQKPLLNRVNNRYRADVKRKFECDPGKKTEWSGPGAAEKRWERLDLRILPGATGGFECFGDREDQFVIVRAADDLHADGETVGRKVNRDGGSRKSCKIEPLRIAHDVQIARATLVVSCSVSKRGRG